MKGKHFNDIDKLSDYLKQNIKYNDIIYIKGSHAMNLDKIKETFN